MTKDELQKTLELHKLWLRGDVGGIRADLSGAYLYGVDLPRINLTGADLSKADLFKANLFGACLYGANLSVANLSVSDLSGANLSKADLSKANLSGANLFGADLSGANLSEANLYGADLSGAKLYGTIYENKVKVGFTYQRHLAFYFGMDEIRIGYHVHNIAHWLENFEKIGKDAGYTPDQIAKYGRFIKSCAADYKRSKK